MILCIESTNSPLVLLLANFTGNGNPTGISLKFYRMVTGNVSNVRKASSESVLGFDVEEDSDNEDDK